jgi:hypothetical protein
VRTGLFAAVGFLAVAGCGSQQPERHPMVQREIDQCIAGMGGLVPDERQRKMVCECTADVMHNPALNSDSELDAMAKCRDQAGLDPKDPFDILDDNEGQSPSPTPTASGETTEGYDDAGYASEQ